MKPYKSHYKKPQQKRVDLAFDQKRKPWLKITFGYDPILVREVKTLPGRKWVKEKKFWVAPLIAQNINYLQNKGFKIADSVIRHLNEERQRKLTENVDVPNFNATLRPYQKEGVLFLDELHGNGIIGDEMGLGKTVQALAYIQRNPKLRPVVIVSPAFLKYNWMDEIEKFLTNKPMVHILQGMTPYDLPISDIYIVNYEILKEWNGKLVEQNPQICIYDEAHYFKNEKAKRTKAVQALSKHVPKNIPMSGTPIESRPSEMYNAINMVSPGLFANRYHFLYRYCNPKNNGFGMVFNGATNVTELKALLKTVMIRRLKVDVLTELPDKTYIPLKFELTNEKIYQDAKVNFKYWIYKQIKQKVKQEISSFAKDAEELQKKYGLEMPKLVEDLQHTEETKVEESFEKTKRAMALIMIGKLRQLAVEGKMKSILDWLDNFIEETEEKIVVFSIHKKTVQTIQEHFSDISLRVDGSVGPIKKQDMIRKFQNDKRYRIFNANMQAGGVGTTLTAASKVLIVEYPDTPAKLDQAIDRVHRISQLNKVFVYLTIGNNTIENKIVKVLDEKRKLINEILDGKPQESLPLIDELLNDMML